MSLKLDFLVPEEAYPQQVSAMFLSQGRFQSEHQISLADL